MNRVCCLLAVLSVVAGAGAAPVAAGERFNCLAVPDDPRCQGMYRGGQKVTYIFARDAGTPCRDEDLRPLVFARDLACDITRAQFVGIGCPVDEAVMFDPDGMVAVGYCQVDSKAVSHWLERARATVPRPARNIR